MAATSAATPPPIDCGERDASRSGQSQAVASSRKQSQSVASSRNQSHSFEISRNRSQSVAISCNQPQSISCNQSQSARSPDPAAECNGSAPSPPRACPRSNERNVHRPRPCHSHQAGVPLIGPRHGSRRQSPSNPPDEGSNHRATHLMREAITEQPT